MTSSDNALATRSELFAAFDAGGREALSRFSKSDFDCALRQHLPELLSRATLRDEESQQISCKLNALANSIDYANDVFHVFNKAECRSFFDFRTHVFLNYCAERFPSIPPAAAVAVGACDICLEVNQLIRQRPCCQFWICQTCLITATELAITDGHLLHHCLACQARISRQEVALYVPKQLQQRFIQFVADVEENSNFRMCPGCGLRTQRGASRIIQCKSCQLQWCFHCISASHWGRCEVSLDQRLKQWTEQQVTDSNCTAGSLQRARACPKCHVIIERNGGCTEMICTRCGTNFCFICGKDIELEGKLCGYIQKSWFGDHSSRLSPYGCSRNFMPHWPMLRKLTRRSIFSLQLCGTILISPILMPLRLMKRSNK